MKIRLLFAVKILAAIFVSLIVLLRLEIIGSPMQNMSFRYSDKQIIKQFINSGQKPQLKYHAFNDRTIRYLVRKNRPGLPTVVFIHGAPGSLSDYSRYFGNEALFAKANLISVDRLGYGYSGFGKSETSIRLQGKAIHSIIRNECENSEIILVGHSYGGPVAIQMAMDFGDGYKAVILLAPALDPGHEKKIMLARLPAYQPIRWLTPPALRVAADEKNTHVAELKKMLGRYDLIKIPVCHIHGTSDSLVPYENVAFSRRTISPKWLETISLENVDHFLPWSHYDLVVDKILEIASGHGLSSEQVGNGNFSYTN
ncbi:MAG: alpha/beta hydrolase [Cytophagales bacterium]|nr:alpha/beta hydrolase [Cytophagales bacterium]